MTAQSIDGFAILTGNCSEIYTTDEGAKHHTVPAHCAKRAASAKKNGSQTLAVTVENQNAEIVQLGRRA